MRPRGGWIAALLGVACLWAAALEGAPCAPSATALCLSAQRFSVQVHWKDFQGGTGQGRAVPLTADTGYFWFFNDANIELVVKVLDARAINGKYWVFFGALSNVEYDLTVADSATGASKTYHNPAGQFASIGDTSAFATTPIGASAAHETVRLTGTAVLPESLRAIRKSLQATPAAATAPAAFTPCPATPFGFNLGGCRFHIEASWKDTQGNTGDGQPVQLTNDTGYFWFFSDSNVELMVKVLDARAVNGSFWVFFGALSNVEYTLTVTDTVTGAVKLYRNPSGLFASVGDTGAFRAGYSVASVPDPSRAVSKGIDSLGGSLTATGADGTVFTLEVPQLALLTPTIVTMTPVSRIDRLPFSGGFLAGVELEPEGLRLLSPATLTIRPTVAAPANRTLPYAYRSGGEEFILYPRTDDGSLLSLPVFHFSGYGAGSGNGGDVANQSSRQPGGALDGYQQQIASWKFQELLNLITHQEFLDHLVDILQHAYDDKVKPDLDKAKETCDRAKIKESVTQALELARLVQIWGLADDLRLSQLTHLLEFCVEILRSCQQKAFERCTRNNDPFEASLMVYIALQLQALGDDDPYLTTFTHDGVIESCLRFELDFESKVVDDQGTQSTGTVERLKFRSAHVPLRLSVTGNPYAHGAAWDGDCTLVPEVATFDFRGLNCTAACQPGNGTFRALAMWIDGLTDTDTGNAKIVMFYDPGAPQSRCVETCNGQSGPPEEPGPSFELQYQTWHADERVEDYYNASGYFVKNWEMLRAGPGSSQNGWYFAKKSYERSKQVGSFETITEETFIFLKHTPAKPMPDCPP